MTLFTFMAQGLGFAKLWLVARQLGVGADLDGYYLALVPSSLIVGVSGGLLQTGYFPLRAKEATTSIEMATRLDMAVLQGVLSGGAVLGLLYLFPGLWLRQWLGDGISAEASRSLMLAWPWAAAMVWLGLMTETVGYLLAARNRYLWAAAASVLNPLLGLTVLLVWPEGGVSSLLWATVGGQLIQLMACWLVLGSSGFAGKVGADEVAAVFRKLLRLGGWILPGTVFSNFTAALPSLVLARFGDGAVSAFNYAYRLHSFLLHGLIMGSGPVILARFSTLVTNKDWQELNRLLRKAVVLSLGIGAAVTLLVWAAGAELLAGIFSGRFDVAAAQRVADHWFWLSAGLAGGLLGNVFAKLWQARKMARWMSLLAGLALVVFALAGYFLRPVLGEAAVPLALSLSGYAVVLAGWRSTRVKE